jgi:ATP-binding cassette, subfamily C, type I secretion system permease/ATPase
MSRSKTHRHTVLDDAKHACMPGLIATGIFSFILNLLVLTGPMFMLQVYDRVLSSKSIPTLLSLSILAVVLYAFYGIFDGLRGRLLASLGALFDKIVRGTAFDAIQKTGINTLNDVKQIRAFLTGNGLPAMFDLPWMPIYLIAIFFLHPWLGYFGFAGALVLLLIAAANELFAGRQAHLSHDIAGRSNQILTDVSRNAGTVKAMGMREALKRRWLSAYDAAAGLSGVVGKRAALFASMTKTARFIIQSGSLALGAFLVIRGELSPGAMIAVSIILSRALSPVEQVIGHWRSLSNARVSLQHLKHTLAVTHTPQRSTELPLPRTKLEIANLAVAAPGMNSLVLKGVSFGLEAGDGLAVIGPSGAGKSSLARTLVGIWTHAHGEIRFDGAPLAQYSEEAIGGFVGYLPQSIELFEGTIAENISRFQSGVSIEEIIEAATLAGCHDMILNLEDGYNTDVGPSGQKLSGGQRQRIALARAVFGKPFILLLDEPNSNLDSEGESALNSAIAAMRQAGSIVITIAHRPSALAAMSKIAVIQSGKLSAFGPKDIIMKQLRGEQQQASNGPTLKAVHA